MVWMMSENLLCILEFQAVVATNGAVYYAPTQPAPLNNIPNGKNN